MARDPEYRAHQEWLGYLQPVGLVVSPPALLAAQAHVNRNIVPAHQRFLEHVTDASVDGSPDPVPAIADLPDVLQDVLGWDAEDLVGGSGADTLPDDLEVTLPEYNETLRPTYAVMEPEPEGEDASRWQLLIQTVGNGEDLDQAHQEDDRKWQASPQSRFERLLRETTVPVGLLASGTQIRLVYAPRGETSGYVTFPVKAMAEVAGRPIFAALQMLLSAERLFTLPRDQRLPAILSESRKYQNEVSTKLADQVLGALWELLRGFQAADEATNGRLLTTLPREDPEHIYGGLLTVLLRLVFLLYAEDRGLMPDDSVYAGHYSVSKLYEQLREDAGRYPDTMDQRYGAWAWLLSLFRLVFDGGGHGPLHLPARHGQLFDPDEYPFLEGRPPGVSRVLGERIDTPRISDGCVHRVVQALLLLDGERLSYRSLDVEQIGSVYEAMMGFEVQQATGRSIGVRRRKKGMNLDVVFNVEELLELEGGKRKKWLKDTAECDLTGSAATDLRGASTPEEVVAALGTRASPRTPTLLPPGTLYLQPGEERRRSGSHYTPRELTEPIVRTTLRPVFETLGERPAPDQILELKVCDPAMGSGAFLVEACRQLAEKLVEAWEVHDCLPEIPPDEDPLLYARRLIAQRCLYGVDKNPFAVNLAKLSLWLVTLAKDHPFTFIDHLLKCGDSLVGLTREQIGAFHWKPQKKDHGPLFQEVQDSMRDVVERRSQIATMGDDQEWEKRQLLREAEEALHDARLTGDLIIAAFFGEEKDKDREVLRLTHRNKLDLWRAGSGDLSELQGIVDVLRAGERPMPPFHWEIEFPEVFGRENPGFDAIVGNPPFLGGKRISTILGHGYSKWLPGIHAGSSGNTDLVAHFFRRAHQLLRDSGAFGLIATNTIAQGATRAGGLYPLCSDGATIYSAVQRHMWPGSAAVVVSIIHIFNGQYDGLISLDGRRVERITAFLFDRGGHSSPPALRANADGCYVGVFLRGMGFTFDVDDKLDSANSIADMRALIESNPDNGERILPYIGGAELNSSPTLVPRRYVIDFTGLTEGEARSWPDLMNVVERRVRPERMQLGNSSIDRAHKARWWLFASSKPQLRARLCGISRTIVTARISNTFAFAFCPSHWVFNDKIVVFPYSDYGTFCVLQSRLHEVWARFFSSTLKDDLQYTPSDCFSTFPFPGDWTRRPALATAGEQYYEYRTGLLKQLDIGLTDLNNRFNSPDDVSEPIVRLRDLHSEMDRAVLDSYHWNDVSIVCEFTLDYVTDGEERQSTRKKPWRYRWIQEMHDEVLARLLSLNQERAEEERLRSPLSTT